MKKICRFYKAVAAGLGIIWAFAVLVFFQNFTKAAESNEEIKSTYNKKCAICHGADGAAKTAKGRKSKTKDVRAPEVQKMSDEQWYEIIVKGKGENMDGFRKEFTDDQIHGLVQYMRDLAKQPP